MSVIPIVKGLGSSEKGVNITDTATTHKKCKAVYVGLDGDYKFYRNNGWVQYNGLMAGVLYPIRATGASTDLDGNPPANAIVFEY